jgi:hypothetical protein
MSPTASTVLALALALALAAGDARRTRGPRRGSTRDSRASKRNSRRARLDVVSERRRLKPIPFHEPFWFAVAGFRPDVAIVDG